jgi:DNA polymerase/3'-5' exonuclease PolX
MEEEKKCATKKTPRVSSGPKNKDIIDALTKIAEYHKAEGDKGRTLAYFKALTSIKQYDKEIKAGKDLEGLPRIGKAIIEKV